MECEYCHKPIEHPRKGQRFCDGVCRSAWHNGRKVKIDKIPDLLKRAFERVNNGQK